MRGGALCCWVLTFARGSSLITLSGCRAVAQEYNAGIEARARMLELVPPGRVIMLRPLKTAGARVGYDAVWAKPEEIIREVRSPCASA